MRYTPAPWVYDDESGDVIAPKCGYQWVRDVCVIATVAPLDYTEGSGNGMLIAAAPDMLAALFECRAELYRHCIDAPALAVVEAAIVKAIGVSAALDEVARGIDRLSAQYAESQK